MRDTIHKLIVGVAGPTAGCAISISTVETWLRVLSLVVGITVGVLSAISIALSIQRKWKMRLKKENILEETTTT